MTDGQPNTLVSANTRTYGRLPSRPQVVNPLDEFVGLEQRLRWLRLKEWIGFTLVHPELYSSMVVQDAHYVASSEIYAYDCRSGELHQHASNALGGSLELPSELFGSACSYVRPGYEIQYEFGAERGTHTIRFDVAPTERAPALRGELTLDGGAASPPLSVSSRLPGGAMYTHKRLYPASGSIQVGAAEFVFEPSRDLAIIDEHRSFLPYRTRWLWGTFARIALDGPVGANFISRPELPGEPEESCIWTPDAGEPLAGISFAPASADPLSPWHIWSADGRLDVTFEPDGRKDVKHQLVVAAIDYFQLFGRYTGTLRGADRTYTLRDVHGVCESMVARL
ncbi:MAG TPA: DUF2804 family protein [Solirubrobacteraceae bacterium]|nr:DUF2804 family protein [Solirubrobacteraceae bacterium]